jgi:hypothetical protein
MDERDDSMLVELGNALVQTERVVVNKVRPLLWRQYLSPSSADPAVEYIEMQKRVDFANLKPIDPQNQVYPLTSESKTSTRLSVVEFGSGLRVMDDELERAARTGDAVASNRIAAIFRKAEETMDRIAAIGYVELGLRGMLNQPDVTPISAGVTGNWDGATSDQILADLNIAVDGVLVQTGEVTSATELVLPPAAFRIISRKIFQTNSPDTVLQVFQRQNPGVRVRPWTHATTAGTNGRIMAWAGGDKDVFDIFVPRGLTADQPIRIKRGYEQAYYMKTGGVYSLYPQAIVYVDGSLS